MDKIVFHRNNPPPSKGTMVIRVRPAAYIELEAIANDTGLPIADIATTLIMESMKHVEVID